MELADRGNRIATDELGRRRRAPSQVRGRAAAPFRPPACGSGQPSSASFLTSGPGYSVGMSNLVVVRDEVDGWDVIREDDPQALTNTPTKQAAIEAARRFLADEGDDGEVVVLEREVHAIDDTGRGVKLYVMALLGLLAVIIAIIVVTSLLAHWTLPGGG
jgi:Uncharacterized protein conserved in bacteria (DUF2188)